LEAADDWTHFAPKRRNHPNRLSLLEAHGIQRYTEPGRDSTKPDRCPALKADGYSIIRFIRVNVDGTADRQNLTGNS
jgi:hypothetical protein